MGCAGDEPVDARFAFELSIYRPAGGEHVITVDAVLAKAEARFHEDTLDKASRTASSRASGSCT